MSDFEYGSDEHLDGLSRDALKSEVRWWHGRALEMEAENAELVESVQNAEHEESVAWDRVRSAERRNDELRKLLVDFRNAMWSGGEWTEPFDERMRELGVEV